MGRTEGWIEAGGVLGMILLCALLTWLAMLAADRPVQLLGRTAADVVGRISGVLLAGLANQFIFDDLAAASFVGH
jgi:multiple antibiotic resistance protein